MDSHQPLPECRPAIGPEPEISQPLLSLAAPESPSPVLDLPAFADIGAPPVGGPGPRPDRRPLINRLIAGCEMLGGTLGLGMIASAGTRIPAAFVLLFASVFGTCLVAGVWLWMRDPRGLRLSLAVQALQSVFCSVFGLTYVFAVGPMFLFAASLGHSSFRVQFYAGLTGLAHLYIGQRPAALLRQVIPPDGTFVLGVNFVALAAAIYLYRQVHAVPEHAGNTWTGPLTMQSDNTYPDPARDGDGQSSTD